MYFSLGAAIWMGVKPLFKIYGTIAAGYLAAHLGILTPQAGRTISWMVLFFFTPSLIFYNIVQNIKDTDIEMLGVLCLSGAIFYTIGLLFGFFVYNTSPIPRGWFGGLLLCCMINNASDMPVAYVQTIGESALMPEGSGSLGSAYAVLFSLMFNIVTYNLGGSRLVEWDFIREDPNRNESTTPYISWKTCRNAWNKLVFGKGDQGGPREVTPKNEQEDEVPQPRAGPPRGPNSEFTQHYFGRARSRSHSTLEAAFVPADFTDTVMGNNQLFRYSTAQSVFSSVFEDSENDESEEVEEKEPDVESGRKQLHRIFRARRLKRFKHSFKAAWHKFEQKNFATMYTSHFLHDIFTPQMVALISGITVAMIPWAKRCFSNQQHIGGFRDPPDGLPPLDFIMVFLNFFAGAQIPLGLIMVGGTIQRLKIGRLVPGFWRTALLIAAFKLALLPIIACGWIVALRRLGWISKDDPLVAIVLAVDSGTPSANAQVYLTALHSDPDGEQMEMNSLGMCLILQYIFMPITITILVTFVLKHFSA